MLPSLEGHNDPERIQAIVSRSFELNPDISGVYSIGSGNQPLVEALKRHRKGLFPVTIVHELTPLVRIALEEGEIDAVITQDVGHLIRSAIRVLKAKCDNVKLVESQERIRTDIVLKENIPGR